MGIFLNDAALEQMLLVSLGFLVVALLGWLLVQLIHLESAFQEKRHIWLKNMQRNGKQLRATRRMLEKAQHLPAVPLPSSLRKKWRVIGWITTALSATKWARS
jgi:hypothetical protein